jgi:hypothetical protein
MGSYPRREKAEQKARERADTMPALDCPVTDCALVGIQVFQNEDFIEEGGSRESGFLAFEHHRHNIVHWIPVANVCNDLTFLPFRAPDCEFAAALERTYLVDCHVALVTAAKSYHGAIIWLLLGATPEQLADFDSSHRRWGQGTVQITLQPCRKNLLRMDYLAVVTWLRGQRAQSVIGSSRRISRWIDTRPQ